MPDVLDPTPPDRPSYSPHLRTALVFTGTGTAGAYHAGVLRALHEAGFTDRLLDPSQGRELLRRRIGVTNLVNRATASADELDVADYERGGRRIAAKVRRYRPKIVAFVGMGAYRVAFGRPRARGGPQEERLAGTIIWVLPNPSGRTAGYQMPALARAFRELRESLSSGTLSGPGR